MNFGIVVLLQICAFVHILLQQHSTSSSSPCPFDGELQPEWELYTKFDPQACLVIWIQLNLIQN